MTLSDRIADVRRKAVAWREITATSPQFWRAWGDWDAVDPDLIIQMADRIEELEKAAQEISTLVHPPICRCGTVLPVGHYCYRCGGIDDPLAASRALNGEKL